MKRRKKSGRPPIDGAVRSERIEIRVTPRVKNEMVRKARILRTSISGYLLSLHRRAMRDKN